MWNDAGKSREYVKKEGQKGTDHRDNGWSLSAIRKQPCPLLVQMNKRCFSPKRPPTRRHPVDKSSRRKHLGGLVWEPRTTCGDTTASKKTRSGALKRRSSFRVSVGLLGEPVKHWGGTKKAKKKKKNVFGEQMMLLITTQAGMAQPITWLETNQTSMADRTLKNNYFLLSTGTLNLSLPSKVLH